MSSDMNQGIEPMKSQAMPADWLEAIERFHEATERLRGEYKALRRQVRSLTRDLQDANEKLRANLNEKERLKSYLERILEGLNVGVIVTDLNGRITLLNESARGFLGVEEHIETGHPLARLFNGSLSPVEVQRLMSPLESGRKMSMEREIHTNDRLSFRLILNAQCLRGQSGSPLGLLVTLEDITELRSMQEEMARNQRLAAMGEMAASIAHDVRNPLGSIELFSRLMAEEDISSQRLEILARIRSAIRSVDHLLSNLLTFSRPLVPRPRPIRPAEVLRSCKELISPLARQKGVRLEMDEHCNGNTIMADENLLKQALLNVLLNAFQATPRGGTVKMSANWKQSPMEGAWEGMMDDTSKWLEFEVEDNGEGIPQDVMPRVFDPFFTTREGGTGLGLAIVHNIACSHGGGVRIQSQPKRGTRVRIRIPHLPHTGAYQGGLE